MSEGPQKDEQTFEESLLAWIDNASLEDLLRKWRFGKVGDPLFVGKVGEHFKRVLFGKRDEDGAAWTRASKRIGWTL